MKCIDSSPKPKRIDTVPFRKHETSDRTPYMKCFAKRIKLVQLILYKYTAQRYVVTHLAKYQFNEFMASHKLLVVLCQVGSINKFNREQKKN